MSKNSQFTYGANPSVTMKRSKFNIGYDKLLSCNLGDLVPFYVEEVLPGDTFKITSKAISRVSSSFIKPAFANMYLDMYHFFVPSRILYDRFEEVFGYNPDGHWSNPTPAIIPSMTFDPSNAETPGLVVDDRVHSGSVADYLEVPVSSFTDNVGTKPISVLPFRAFAKIYDDWFRDQNYIDPMAISKGELSSLSDERLNNKPWTNNNYTGMLPKVAKLHDMFSTVLPSPQKGDPVDVIAGYPQSFLPLKTNPNGLVDLGGFMRFNNGGNSGVKELVVNGSSTRGNVPSNGVAIMDSDNAGINDGLRLTGVPITSTNLGVENPVRNAVTVNDLREAFAVQRILERSARCGTRYVEVLKSVFGVSAGDGLLQRAEYLGHSRLSIGISQVAQTSAAAGHVGDLGGYSLDGGVCKSHKAFSVHGWIIGVLCYRQYHTYQQGLDARYTRFTRYDHYDPALAFLGEKPVMKTELYAGAPANQILGYMPIFNSYRYHNNKVCGQMRSDAPNSLDMWHIADDYANAPTMNKQFIEETPIFLNRILNVKSDAQDQFILNIYNDVEAIRVMPPHPHPGLIDHY